MAPPLNRPTTCRMVDAARANLALIRAQLASADLLSKLGTIDVILNELVLREDAGRHQGYYGRVLPVLDQGLVVLKGADADKDYQRAARLRAALPDMLDEGDGFATSGATIDKALACLEALVAGARGATDSTIAAFVTDALAIENALYSEMATDLPPAAKAGQDLPTQESLQSYLAERFPDRAPRVTELRHLVGGYQKITMLFETEDKDGTRQSLVFRGEKPDQFVTLPASAVVDEFEVVTLAWKAGLPVAEPILVEADAGKLGRRFMVSRRVAGENLGSAIATADAISDDTLRSFVTTLAQIHATSLKPGTLPKCLKPWHALSDLRANTKAAVEMWRRQMWTERASPSAVLTRLYTWLADNVPQESEAPCLVHVDYGPHNVLVADGAVSGILDWEASRIGDPAEDLSYLLQCLGGAANRDLALRWYNEASGRNISQFRLRYFDCYNLQKMVAGPMAAAIMFEETPEASIEWCNIPLRWMAFGAGGVAERIALAEAAR